MVPKNCKLRLFQNFSFWNKLNYSLDPQKDLEYAENMKKAAWYLLLFPAMLIACKSAPPAEEYPLEEEPVIEQFLEEEPEIHHAVVTQEMYEQTLAEVRLFVDNLNSLIRGKNYNGWKAALSDDLFARFSSPEFLASASESNLLRSRKIVLKNTNDYFLQVVVPSRSNSRVDEIEFIDEDRVKVFYVEERVRRTDNESSTEIRRLRLYELIKDGETWKITD